MNPKKAFGKKRAMDFIAHKNQAAWLAKLRNKNQQKQLEFDRIQLARSIFRQAD